MHWKRSGSLVAGGMGLVVMGATLVIVKVLMDIAHIVGAALALAGLVMIAASFFGRRG